MMLLLSELIRATGAQLVGNPARHDFTGFAYDSRLVEPGQVFAALVTDTGDGHRYITQAVEAGAAAVLCQHMPERLQDGVAYLTVGNTQQALNDYARYILAARKVEVIGVTGSLGKTSTKEAAAEVLSQRYEVFKSYANYNGRLGLAITLGKHEPAQRLAVLELASDSVNEIRDLAEITRPTVGIVTNISASHIQLFGSLERITFEKARLIQALPETGYAILNYDDPRVRSMAEQTRAHVISFGLNEGFDLAGSSINIQPDGTSMTICHAGRPHQVRIPLLGEQHAYTMLAASALGILYGLSWDEISAGLASVQPLPGRTRLLAGINGSQILDDSYNANPTSAIAALRAAAALPAQRRWFLFGDMAQLGEYATDGYLAVGRAAGQLTDVMVTKGEHSQLAAEEAIKHGLNPAAVHVTYTAQDAARILQAHLQPGDLLLVKGSAEARLEMVTRELLADPSLAPALLPRQNSGWRSVRLQRPDRPTWVEIDLEAIAYNVRRIKDIVGAGVAVMAVLKADGYGHGAVKVARTALNNGAAWLGVACLGEALALRSAGITAPLLVLGYTPAWQARDAVLNDITVTVFSAQVAEALARAAADLGRTAACHVKVDTGMGRLGLMPEEVLLFMQMLHKLPRLQVDGIFTHMSSADEADPAYTLGQLRLFDGVLEQLQRSALTPPHIHAANSAALLRYPQSRYNLVRPGIALFGLNPSSAAVLPADFKAALSFKSQIAQVKQMPTGSAVSYGRKFTTQRPSRIAVIPVGYADGFRRTPHNWGYVLVRGQRAPIVGAVCMDQTMLDVTDIPQASQGDEVVLIGTQGGEVLSVDQVAQQLGTINYEVVSEILARVPRLV
ncbi:MAG: alanine racemase [Chloroflexi bacterium]|nr:alanine racemase [Chloroflexota bacterium]